MATYKENLSKSGIKKLQVGDKLWDATITGLYAHKQQTKVSFYYKYRINNKQRLTNLGTLGSISIEDVKEKAREYYLLANQCIDPVSHQEHRAQEYAKKLSKENYTIEDAYKAWEIHYKPKLKKSSLSEWTLYPRYISPKFGNTPLAEITPEDINLFHASIERPYSANRSIKILKKLFNIAKVLGYFEGNEPFVALKLNPEKKRRRHLANGELVRLYDVLEHYKHAGPEEFKARCCVLLYLLTSARKKEWLSTPKSWIDLKKSTLSLPDTKNGEPDEKFLPHMAVEILEELFEKYPSSPWIFPSPKKKGHPLENIKRHWNKIRTEADITDVRLHDLRRTFASIALSSNVGLAQIGEVLNHKNLNTTRGYAYLMENSKKETTELVSRKIIEKMHGTDDD